MTTLLVGTMSTFGGPDDTTGVSPSEGLALCEPSEVDLFPEDMFLDTQPPGTTGLARRLNPNARYIAMRWDYEDTPRAWLQQTVIIVRNPENGMEAAARPIDWGPHVDTGRICDLSPGLAEELELDTDDTVELKIPTSPDEPLEMAERIVISSGHGLYVRGAAGIIDEVDEARNVVEKVAKGLRLHGVTVHVFHDNTSTTQSENLSTIVKHHNSKKRDLDVSVHFNAYEPTDKPRGTEVLYLTQSALANDVACSIASCGFINRGAKKRTDLYFLNKTSMPAVLLEVCFVDSKADVDVYRKEYDAVCEAIAAALTNA